MRHLVGTCFYTATLASVAHVSVIDLPSMSTLVVCIADLVVTKESKMELGVVCDLSAPAVCLLFSSS